MLSDEAEALVQEYAGKLVQSDVSCPGCDTCDNAEELNSDLLRDLARRLLEPVESALRIRTLELEINQRAAEQALASLRAEADAARMRVPSNGKRADHIVHRGSGKEHRDGTPCDLCAALSSKP